MKLCTKCRTKLDDDATVCGACEKPVTGKGNRHYVNGAAFERRVKARLEERGLTVFRTAGSHSPADLIAMQSGPWLTDPVTGRYVSPEGTMVTLVQCKGGAKPMARADKARFKTFAENLGAQAVVFSRGMVEEKL